MFAANSVCPSPALTGAGTPARGSPSCHLLLRVGTCGWQLCCMLLSAQGAKPSTAFVITLPYYQMLWEQGHGPLSDIFACFCRCTQFFLVTKMGSHYSVLLELSVITKMS